jgi:hypothetical protein
MQNVAGGFPDFFFWLGDDFSIDPMIDSGKLSPANVDAVYLNQRGYVGAIGGTVPVFPVNGNHEEGAAYLLTPEYSTPYAQAPIYAGSSRVKYFALPGTDGFYSADSKEVSGVGKIRDYYAFTWGDALFVTIDPYWHSPVPVDNGVPGVTPPKDGWEATMGDDQYEWFKSTLEGSKAKYKFVLAHHVNGTGRGGAAIAHEYEWGGYDQAGKTYEFTSRRPAWSKPIHQLMKDSNVTIFFFGHDHLFAREKVDSVVYQSVPCPADNTYAAFNSDAYDPATITFPGAEYDPDYGAVVTNAGHLNVTVAPDRVTVDYVRSVLPGDEAKAGAANGQISYSYSVTAE